MYDDELAIGREMHVELDAINAQLHGLVERLQRVFRRVGAVAAVGDD
jgi:hypothetical protein